MWSSNLKWHWCNWSSSLYFIIYKLVLFLTRWFYIFVHVIMWKWKYDHITSTLPDDLHWLPIRQRIMYKLSTIVYKCIHGAAPSYLTNLCVPVATNKSRRYLRSATHGDLLVPRTRTVIYEPRSYAVSGPTGWNTLPSTLHVSITTPGQFHSGLKTILFRLAYGTWLGAFVTVYAIRLAPYKYSYLLTYRYTYSACVCVSMTVYEGLLRSV